MSVEGFTVSEIAKELGITEHAVRKRLETASIKPKTREAVYDKSVVKILMGVKMGRPKKAAEKPPQKQPGKKKHAPDKAE